jgi:nucleoside-diphosphate-sugar epimerase
MNVLIIGGTGFISAETARQLHDAGHTVVLYHRSRSANLPYRQFQGDRDDAGRLSECIARAEPDCILHTCAMNKRTMDTLAAALTGIVTRSISNQLSLFDWRS